MATITTLMRKANEARGNIFQHWMAVLEKKYENCQSQGAGVDARRSSEAPTHDGVRSRFDDIRKENIKPKWTDKLKLEKDDDIDQDSNQASAICKLAIQDDEQMRTDCPEKTTTGLAFGELREVTAAMTAARAKWPTVRRAFFVALWMREIRMRLTGQRKTKEESSTPRLKTKSMNEKLKNLEEFYRKFDAVVEELEDRTDLIELEGFKQLVIREIAERSEALRKFQERLKLVQGQLIQKFVIDDLVEEGLIPLESSSRDEMDEKVLDWEYVDNYSDLEGYQDGSEWVICE
jgi:hypothetical protein